MLFYSVEREVYERLALERERIYVFVYKAGRHMVGRYLPTNYSIHLKVKLYTL